MKCAWAPCKTLVVGKKYCSSKHRTKDYRRRLDDRSRSFEALPIGVTEYSPDYAELGNWQTLAPQLTIRRGAPSRSVFYRLGCSSPIAHSPMIRWFPSQIQVPLGMWRLDPFEEPSVPFAGHYCVALFDDSGRFIHCDRRVYIEQPNATMRWRAGDQGLEVDPEKVASALRTEKRSPIAPDPLLRRSPAEEQRQHPIEREPAIAVRVRPRQD